MPLQVPDVKLAAVAPEIALCIAALLLVVVDSFIRERVSRLYLPIFSSVALFIAAGLAIQEWEGVHATDPQLQLSGMVVLDGFAIFVKVVLAIFGALTIWLGREYLTRERTEESEFYALVLFSLAGMMLMATSADLIVMFLALETFSIALYVLVGFRWGSLESQEASLKYFLLGAFSSAFFLLGIALCYGAIGSTGLYAPGQGGAADGIAQFLRSTSAGDQGLLVLGAGFLIVGLGFKVAAVPFHMWTPDAYQGAPSPVTGFMAAASKLAGFAALFRLFDGVLFPLRWDWRPILIGIAIATMIVGAALAVVQEDLKRILAYSSIAHAGYLLVGLIAGNDDGVSGALFYLATYGITVLGAFAIVSVLSGRNEARGRLTDHKGLFYEHPLLVGTLTLFMLSLAGVPLTVGFVGKLVVFGAAVEEYWWLVIVGVVSSAIAAFFYLRVLVVMYMQEPEGEPASLTTGPATTVVIGLAAVATIALGLYWGPLIDLAERATFYFAGS